MIVFYNNSEIWQKSKEDCKQLICCMCSIYSRQAIIVVLRNVSAIQVICGTCSWQYIGFNSFCHKSNLNFIKIYIIKTLNKKVGTGGCNLEGWIFSFAFFGNMAFQRQIISRSDFFFSPLSLMVSLIILSMWLSIVNFIRVNKIGISRLSMSSIHQLVLVRHGESNWNDENKFTV